MNSSFNPAFREALNSLNSGQRQAVEQIEGPVLVIAGPGTGKTQILAARIGNILQQQDVSPHNILCLTYTDAGTVAMRERLHQFIGPDAYRVHISTFHAFCNEIIQENLEYFGKLNLEPVSELEEIELLEKLIDSFPPDHALKRFTGDVYFERSRLKNLFSAMKKEDWTAEFITGKIEQYLAELPFREEFQYKASRGEHKKGDPNMRLIDEQKERMELLRAAAGSFRDYQKLMKQAGRYDYDDMILWVIKAFKENRNILLNYQERYQYVLVDEYQDTNGSQNELLKLLISYWERPNVFVVGDDDQSIFRFQGANVANILDFANTYRDSVYKVVLTSNYRSSQAILDTASMLIGHNRERLTRALPDISKELRAENSRVAALDKFPSVTEYADTAHEVTGIAKQIQHLLASGVSPDEIAVIYRNHSQCEELVTFLQQKNITVTIKRKANILELPLVRRLISMLRYVQLESEIPYSGDEQLFEILHYDFFGIEPVEIARICVEVSRKNYEQYQKSGKKTSIRQEIVQAISPSPTLFDQAGGNGLHKAGALIERWIRDSYNLTLQHLFERMIIDSGMLSQVLQSPDKMWLMQVLNTFFDFLKEENKKDTNLSLAGFLDILDKMQRNGLSIDLHKASYSRKGIAFLTAHGSKGLEFSHVFMMGCTKQFWEKPRSNASRNYKFPDNLLDHLPEGAEEEEARRLFYVGMTRAKEQLHISYPAADKKGAACERSVFVAEVLEHPDVTLEYSRAEEEELLGFSLMQYGGQAEIALPDDGFIDHLLQHYELSVTHLSNYLDCPLGFYFKNLVKVPLGKNEYMTFGSAVHYALQQLFYKMQFHEAKEFPEKTTFLSDFKWYMERNKDAFTREQFVRRIEYGNKILPPYYEQYAGTWNKVASAERSYKHIEMDGIPINGKLDKLEFSGNEVNVVDYKTGQYEKARAKLKRPEENNPQGGDYWRQAVFYKILMDHDRSNSWKMVSAEFDFVEPVKDRYHKEKIYIAPDDISIVKEQIRETYTRIMNKEFTKGCGKETCYWCNFVKNNYKPAFSLSDTE